MEAAIANFMDGDTLFKLTNQLARKIEDAEKRGDQKALAALDSHGRPQCSRCNKFCEKTLTCSGCHAFLYCGRACQVADWKAAIVPGAPSHKSLCVVNQEYMKRLPYFQSELKQFPWGRLESDGTCNHDLLKARFRVLGSGPKFGYWSLPGGRRPHDETSSQRGIRPGEMRSNYTAGYVHGEVLLGNKWPSDIEAWKLKDSKLVPKLVFDGESKPPPQPTADQVKDWKSWYEWRGLDVASPAAILMDFPLSVFYLVTKVLNLVDPSGTPEHRQKLTIHYIGAEVELNFLPLFSELALLMPNTDITLIFFGNAVANLVHRARREYPNSLATRDFVWEYKAPEISGGGSLKIQLYSESGTWSEEVLEGPDGEIGREELPDALVGLNAGIASYPEWTTPLKFAAMFDIPFAITEYAEQTIRQLARDLPAVLESMGMQYESIYPPPDDPLIDNLFKRRAHTVTVNPFHRPGQRPLAHVRSPNLYNGFAVPIVPNSKSSPS